MAGWEGRGKLETILAVVSRHLLYPPSTLSGDCLSPCHRTPPPPPPPPGHSLDILPADAFLVHLPAQLWQRENIQVTLVGHAHQTPLGVGRLVRGRGAEACVADAAHAAPLERRQFELAVRPHRRQREHLKRHGKQSDGSAGGVL